jgi:hypothetical protein
MVEPAVDAPLSPELVLVSPDLKARALVAERIARPQPYLVPPLDEIVPLQPEGASLQAEAAPPELPSVPFAPVQVSPSPPEWHLTVGAATLIVLAAVAVFGTGLAVGRFAIASPASESATPSVVPPAAAPSPAATQNAVPATPSVATPSVAATPVPARPKLSSPSTPAEGGAARAVLPARLRHPIQGTDRANSNPVAARFHPVPNGGYVLPKQRGHFRLSSDARTIVDFTLATSCAGALTLPPIEVGTTGTFAFAGHPGASPSGTTVRVEGRFVSPAEARGTAQVSGSGCRVPAAPFVARLS